MLEKPGDFDVETTKETNVDHVVIVVCTWRGPVKVADTIALRTSPIGKTSKALNQAREHQTQRKCKLTPTMKAISINNVPTTSKTLSNE